MIYPVKLEFKKYGTSDAWADWSAYLSEPPSINRKVESENAGEAGLIVFDNAQVSLYYDEDNPVYEAFQEDNLYSAQRYLFRISIAKSNKSYVQVFEGMADFSTIEWPDKSRLINFDMLDKLSAISLADGSLARSKTVNVYERCGSPSLTDYEITLSRGNIYNGALSSIFVDLAGTGVAEYGNCPPEAFHPGELIEYDNNYYLVAQFYTRNIPSDRTDYNGVPEYYWDRGIIMVMKTEDFPNGVTVGTDFYAYEKTFAGRDINIVGSNAFGPLLTGFNGYEILFGMIKLAWEDVTIINNTGETDFHIPIDYFPQLISGQFFGKEPLDAIKMLADSMQAYIYFDKDGNLVIQKKDQIASRIPKYFNGVRILDASKKYFWDKLIDGVSVKITSWVKVNGEFLVGTSSIAKTFKDSDAAVKPKNELSKELLAGDSTLTTQEALDERAALMASSYMGFYGSRHECREYEIALDDNILLWDLLDTISINDSPYFIETLDISPADKSVKLKLVEIQEHDYDLRQVIIGLSDQSYTSSSSGGSYSSGGSSGYTGNPYLWDGGAMGLDAVKARTNLGLNDVSNLGDKLISNAEFNSLDGVTSNIQTQLNAKESKLTFTDPLVRSGSQISFNYVSKNLRINGAALDTIQDIDTDAAPVFAGLGIGGDAGGWELKVTGNGYLTGFHWVDGYVNGSGGFRIAGNEVISSGRLGYLQGLYVNGAYDANYKLKVYGTANFTGNTSFDSDVTITGNLKVLGDSVTFDVGTLLVEDKNIELAKQTGITPTDSYANGGGLILRGTTDHKWTWDSTYANWTSSEHINAASGKNYKVNNTIVIDANRSGYLQKLALGGSALTEALNVAGNIKQSTGSYFYSNIAQSNPVNFSGWGNTGYILSTDAEGVSNFIVDNLTVRRTLSVYELLIRQIRATNGSQVITAGARFKSIALTNSSSTYTPNPLKPSETITGGLYTCAIDNDDNNYVTFAVNDIVIMQIWSGRSITASWGVVTSTTSNSCTIIYTGGSGYSTPESAHTTAKGKSDWVRIGNITDTARQGMIYLTSDDDGAPFIDVRDGVNSFAAWGSQSTKVRLGKMAGIAGNPWGNQDIYGLYADVAWLTDNVLIGGRALGLLNGMTALFHFDDNLRDSISGTNVTYTGTLNESAYGLVSSSDNSLVCTKVNGKFGGGVAVEEATTNTGVNVYFATSASWSNYVSGSGAGTRNFGKSISDFLAPTCLNLSKTDGTTGRFGVLQAKGVWNGTQHTFSVWYKVNSKMTGASLHIEHSYGPITSVNLDAVPSGQWLRLTGTSSATNDNRYIWLEGANADVDITCFQAEAKSFATEFTESSRVVGIAKYPKLFDVNNNWSVSFYFSFKRQENKILFQIDEGTHLNLYSVSGNKNIRFTYMNTSGVQAQVQGTTALNADTFYYVTLTKEGSAVKLYLNGVLENYSNSIPALKNNNAFYMVLGGYQTSPATYVSNAIFDELAIYNRALTENEIKKIYYSNQPLQESPGMTFISGNRIRTGMLYSENYIAGVSGSMWNLNTGYLETNDGIFRGTVTATSGLIGGWTVDSRQINKTVTGANGYAIALDSITTISGTDYSRPRFLATWGDGTPDHPAGWGGNFITIGAASYMYTSNGQFTVPAGGKWDVNEACGGISINIDGKNILFAGKRQIVDGTYKSGAAIAGFSFDDGKFNVGTDFVLDAVNKKIYFNNKSTFDSSSAGIFLGMDSSAYKFAIGNSSKYLKWDGNNLTALGAVFTGGTFQTAATGSRIVISTDTNVFGDIGTNAVAFYNSNTYMGGIYADIGSQNQTIAINVPSDNMFKLTNNNETLLLVDRVGDFPFLYLHRNTYRYSTGSNTINISGCWGQISADPPQTNIYAVIGDTYFNTATHKVMYWTGSSWVALN